MLFEISTISVVFIRYFEFVILCSRDKHSYFLLNILILCIDSFSKSTLTISETSEMRRLIDSAAPLIKVVDISRLVNDKAIPSPPIIKLKAI
jgi:hypothetical protein